MPQTRLYRTFAAEHIARGPHDVPPQDPNAIQFLHDAEMGDGWLHPSSSNYTFIVELCAGDRRGFGVYKPRAGEAPLWDFPSGTLYKRECAAFELGRLLEWPVVPPTVVREGELGIGSLQLFVPHPPDSNFFALKETHRDDVLRMAVFDIVANNADRKGGHCFLAQAGGVWGVDHGLTFNVPRKLRTVIWDFAGEPVPRHLVTDLCTLLDTLVRDGPPALGALQELLLPEEAAALQQRLEAVIREPVMPMPYSRRDLPWPWL
ncbi:MAG: SCO1664 family protein [Dehalococcoidia bacterium]